jgi:hypothetical protein
MLGRWQESPGTVILGFQLAMSIRLKMPCSMPCLAWVGTILGTINFSPKHGKPREGS